MEKSGATKSLSPREARTPGVLRGIRSAARRNPEQTPATGKRRDKGGTMKRQSVRWTMLMVLIAAAATPFAQAQSRSVPTFEVDRSWPKVPPQWKLGDASSAAIDAKDNVWVLHRPRTLKPEEKSKAAPPVIVFDT